MSNPFICLAVCILPAFGAAPGDSVDFDRYFTDAVLRIDLYHGGGYDSEFFVVKELRREPHLAICRGALIDTLNLGNHLAELFDAESGELIFSRGFCSLFSEWRHTEEAADGGARIFADTIVAPFPRRTVRLAISSRDRENNWVRVSEFFIDPRSPQVDREPRNSGFAVDVIRDTGPPAERVDLVFIGDGYTVAQMDKYRADVRRFVDILFSAEPFVEHADRFNVVAIEAVSGDSGPDEPLRGHWRDTVLDCSFNTFGMDRYLTTLDNFAVRDVAGNVPYDYIIVVVNTGRYGGGGVFRLWSIFCADGPALEEVFLHELGHALAGLGDEYDGADLPGLYPHDVEPWEPNLTTTRDRERIKWRDLIRPGTPIPTPAHGQPPDYIGLFRGGGYNRTGVYRPAANCRMRSNTAGEFCAVCRRAIERVIRFHCGETP